MQSKQLIAIALGLVGAYCTAVAAQGQIVGTGCGFNYTDSQQTQWNYDLSSLRLPAGQDYRGFGPTGQFQYYANVCNSVNCNRPVAAACQMMRDNNNNWVPRADLGFYDGSAAAQWDVIDPSNPQLGMKFVLTNGDATCTGGAQTQTTIFFDCSPTAADPTTVNMTITDRLCTYNLHIATPSACPSSPNAPPAPNPDNGNGGSGLSGGSVFLIIFFVFSFVYVAGGCIYRRVSYGVNGMEACPNHEFWAALPGMVSDGARYFFNTLTCRGTNTGGSAVGGGSRVSYDTMK